MSMFKKEVIKDQSGLFGQIRYMGLTSDLQYKYYRGSLFRLQSNPLMIRQSRGEK